MSFPRSPRCLPLFAALCCAGIAHAQGFSTVAPTPQQLSPAVDQAYRQLMASPAIAKLLDAVKADHERSIEDLRMLTEIEAPPLQAQKRAEAFLVPVQALVLTEAQ